jgi:hypothetical protein
MRLALNMAKMATCGFPRAAIEKIQYLIKKPHAKVRDEKKRGVELPKHKEVKDAIERQPAMLHQIQMDGRLSCEMAPQ